MIPIVEYCSCSYGTVRYLQTMQGSVLAECVVAASMPLVAATCSFTIDDTSIEQNMRS